MDKQSFKFTSLSSVISNKTKIPNHLLRGPMLCSTVLRKSLSKSDPISLQHSYKANTVHKYPVLSGQNPMPFHLTETSTREMHQLELYIYTVKNKRTNDF